MRLATRHHWPEYLMEAAGLAIFMLSASFFGTLLEHPGSALRPWWPDPLVRRAVMGLAMGGTALAIIFSPWGQQSGAHLNPSVTLAYYRLGRIAGIDAVGYMLAQFAGGAGGMALASVLLGPALAEVDFVATLPGRYGWGAAWIAEWLISFTLMSVVLIVSGHPRWKRWTAFCAAGCVALFITLVAPISGMSMNPARTLGSALFAGIPASLWIYFTAPPLGMLTASLLVPFLTGDGCAKMHHANARRCIFCEHRARQAATLAAAPVVSLPAAELVNSGAGNGQAGSKKG